MNTTKHIIPAIARDVITLILIPILLFAMLMLLNTNLQLERLDERSMNTERRMVEMKTQIDGLDNRLHRLETRR